MKALIGAVVLATAYLSGVLSASAEIVVGVNLSLTGPAATLGASWQRSLAMAPKEIGGEAVRYVILDDGTDPSAAVRNVRKLAGEAKPTSCWDRQTRRPATLSRQFSRN